MVDKNILLSKAAAVTRHLNRVQQKRTVVEKEFLADQDRQESILFNLQMAIQSCIDLAAHVVSENNLGIAGSTNELFYLLEENNIIEPALTEKLVRAVGFRNLLVHEYGKLDLTIAYRISHEGIRDLEEFIAVLGRRFG